MNHLYFGFYLLSLLSGMLMLSALAPYYRHSPAAKETLGIHLLLTLFVLWGTGWLYAAVNMVSGPAVSHAFTAGAFCMVGGFTYLLPRHHHKLFDLDFGRKQTLAFGGLALCGPLAAVALWFLPGRYHLWLLGVAVIALAVVVGYCQKLYFGLYPRVFRSSKPKIITLVLPPLSIGIALAEAWWFGDAIVERGVALSLPLIYLLNSAVLWHFRRELFPTRVSTSEPSFPEALTAKEREVVLAVRQGLSNKAIASQLDISPSTVKNHLYNIFKKVGVTNRVALIKSLSNADKPKPPGAF